MDRSRAARGLLAIQAVLFVALVLFFSRAPGPRAWALHLPGFLPEPARALVTALLVLGAALLLYDFLRGESRASPTKGRRPARAAKDRNAGTRMPAWTGWLLLAPWTWLLWRLQARTHFLGDGTVWLRHIQLGQLSPFSEPLAAAAWSAHARMLHALGMPVDALTAALLPIFCGILAGAILWGLALEIAPRGSRVLALALLATMGLAQLYFGYIESYPPVSVAILAYLWLGSRSLRGALHPVVPGLALGIAIAFHLSCAYLAPSYLYLLLRSEQPWPRRAALAVLPAACAAGLLLALGYPPAQWIRAFGVAARAIEPGHGAAALAKPYGVLSLDHGWDLLNAILLALPVPAMLLGTAAAGAATAVRDRLTQFLALAALPGLLLASALVLSVAPAQDWDLTSILLLPLGVLGVNAGLHAPGISKRRALAVGLTALGAGSLLSFVLVNADVRAGRHRYEILVGPGSKITGYGKAYGNEVLATDDSDRGDFAQAATHAGRAIEAEPTNPRYWIKKGAALYELGRYDEAIPLLREGIRRGPWRDDGYYDLGNCLVRTKQYDEAIASFHEAIRLGPPQPDYFHNLGVALFFAGKADSARLLWEDVVRRWPNYPLSRRSLSLHFPGAGTAPNATPTSG
jgi:tetratricopeptide (TPR) repeat protein